MGFTAKLWTPLFTLGLATFLADVRGGFAARGVAGAAGPQARPGFAWIAPALCAVFALWNLLLLSQYALGMINHSNGVPIATLVANQPRVVGRLLHLVMGAAR